MSLLGIFIVVIVLFRTSYIYISFLYRYNIHYLPMENPYLRSPQLSIWRFSVQNYNVKWLWDDRYAKRQYFHLFLKQWFKKKSFFYYFFVHLPVRLLELTPGPFSRLIDFYWCKLGSLDEMDYDRSTNKPLQQQLCVCCLCPYAYLFCFCLY